MLLSLSSTNNTLRRRPYPSTEARCCFGSYKESVHGTFLISLSHTRWCVRKDGTRSQRRLETVRT